MAPEAHHGGHDAEINVRPFEKAPQQVFDFSDVSSPDIIRSIVHSKVPGWSALDPKDIMIDQLLEGLSNQLFKCHVKSSPGINCVLFRVYGSDVGTLYDQALELKIFNMLAEYQVAPRMYAHGDSWRIEEWHNAVALPTRSMRNPSIMMQVAAQLGRLHKLSYRHDFPRDILELKPAAISRLQHWGDEARKAAANLTDKESLRHLKGLGLEDMLAEREWLAKYLVSDDLGVRGAGVDVVFSHNDSQENNILQTHYGLRFIDFEYSAMDYQAYDIANYFCECTIDYNFARYPFYKINLADFPTDYEQRLFLSVYLSEYLESTVHIDNPTVDALFNRVNRFTLASSLLWALWSVIRAPQAPTFNEFDFLDYSKARWDMYKRKKQELLSGARSAAPGPVGSPSNRMKKTPYVLGGALTAWGVVMGAIAAVVIVRVIKG